ncbi:MAG TPA: hypothetical protein VK815_02405 [Candidatus Acidoferrales bacterium]|nr:hypothetical protein [Candidatus Acidoferrales bacterium]
MSATTMMTTYCKIKPMMIAVCLHHILKSRLGIVSRFMGKPPSNAPKAAAPVSSGQYDFGPLANVGKKHQQIQFNQNGIRKKPILPVNRTGYSNRARSVQCWSAARRQPINPSQFTKYIMRKPAMKWPMVEMASTWLGINFPSGKQSVGFGFSPLAAKPG